jgi:hypothetical protein
VADTTAQEAASLAKTWAYRDHHFVLLAPIFAMAFYVAWITRQRLPVSIDLVVVRAVAWAVLTGVIFAVVFVPLFGFLYVKSDDWVGDARSHKGAQIASGGTLLASPVASWYLLNHYPLRQILQGMPEWIMLAVVSLVMAVILTPVVFVLLTSPFVHPRLMTDARRLRHFIRNVETVFSWHVVLHKATSFQPPVGDKVYSALNMNSAPQYAETLNSWKNAALILRRTHRDGEVLAMLWDALKGATKVSDRVSDTVRVIDCSYHTVDEETFWTREYPDQMCISALESFAEAGAFQWVGRTPDAMAGNVSFRPSTYLAR